MFGTAPIGEEAFGSVGEPLGEPIIPEVIESVKGLVLVIEIDLVQPVEA